MAAVPPKGLATASGKGVHGSRDELETRPLETAPQRIRRVASSVRRSSATSRHAARTNLNNRAFIVHPGAYSRSASREDSPGSDSRNRRLHSVLANGKGSTGQHGTSDGHPGGDYRKTATSCTSREQTREAPGNSAISMESRWEGMLTLLISLPSSA